jgi:hypothetical protein
MSPHILVILEGILVTFFTCRRGPLVKRFATHNSVILKVAVSPFLENRGDNL